jgi:hypothetical protein
MKSARKLVDVGPEHDNILAVAALECDLTPQIPNARRMIGYGDTKYGYGPACVMDITATEYVAEPHVIWFPWTTSQNKIVNFKWAMQMLAETHEVLLNVAKEHAPFFDHFTKRGFLRKAGHLTNMPIVEEIHMYQVVKGKHHE